MFPLTDCIPPSPFVTTRWSVILEAQRNDAADSAAALELLCRTYWPPLYSYARRRGHSPHDAEDLTQGFFARLLEKGYLHAADRAKGRFRQFVLMTYALHEALTIVLEEGLEARIVRHEQMHKRLRAGLERLGLGYIPKRSLHTLNCIQIPAGADDVTVRRRLLEEYGIEIGAGLGPMAGKAWRIGLMGHGATLRNVDLVLAALENILRV